MNRTNSYVKSSSRGNNCNNSTQVLRDNLRRQTSFNTPKSKDLRYASSTSSFGRIQPMSPSNIHKNSPNLTLSSGRSRFFSPSTFQSNSNSNQPPISAKSLDYASTELSSSSPLTNNNYSRRYLQVNSKLNHDGSLPHQLSGESTESAMSCFSGTSNASAIDLTNAAQSTSEITGISPRGSQDKLKIWPSFKKLIRDKRTSFSKKHKAEVDDSYVDPVYHLLKCGANPDHNPHSCYCDCHSKSDTNS